MPATFLLLAGIAAYGAESKTGSIGGSTTNGSVTTITTGSITNTTITVDKDGNTNITTKITSSNNTNQSALKIPATYTNNPIYKMFDVSAGLAVLQSFTITPSATPGFYKLNTSSPDVRGIVQGSFRTRYAWRNDDLDDNTDTTWCWQTSKQPLSFDFGARVGYAYGGSGAQSSTTIGSGDAFGQASAGLNLVRFSSPKLGPDYNRPLYTVNFEGVGGFTSDSEYSLLHAAYGATITFVAGVPWTTNSVNPDKFEFVARIGYARVDSPVMAGPGLVATADNGDPAFSMRNAAVMSAELRLPIVKDGYVSFGGMFYQVAGSAPDQWSMYASITFPLDTLVNLVLGIVPKSSSSN